MTDQVKTAEAIRAAVRARYADLAGGGSCCSEPGGAADFCSGHYAPDELAALPETAVVASLGCGNPTAVADLHEGEVVLDLGSGGGIDVLLSAKRVGPSGKVYGLDMTEEMLALARDNARRAGVGNVQWLHGTIEAIPLPDASVDVAISNCVVNLSPDKPQLLREVARVLRPGGRLAFTDVVADPEMDAETRADMEQWTGCIAGALTREEFDRYLRAAGFVEVELSETHRVHAHAGSAVIRARKPTPPAG